MLQYKIGIFVTQQLSINNVRQLSQIGNNIRSVQIEDLLGRDEINITINAIEAEIYNKVVLVTGAAGSIGSEIVRQVALFAPKCIICLDIAETPLNDLELELRERFPPLNFHVIIADVRNISKLRCEFSKYRPDIVYHAAAYKHVPMMERFPCEATLTNILGTKNLVDISIEFNVRAFVMISTDKAVNPTNVMGATKRAAEIYVQATANDSGKNISRTKFVTTRFGNVLGSNGSVIPLFKRQIEEGGPITVTSPEITRYFMTIPEACRLVLEASIIGKSGYIYIFDMGKSTKIVDLAKRMILLSGLTENDIQIIFTGLRPGEKLYEELLNNEEITEKTEHKKILAAKIREYHFKDISPKIEEIVEIATRTNKFLTVEKLKSLVPEFISNNSEFEKFDNNKYG
jgi:FlaA1/EpsC-like NDP-sugar epimerase